MPNSGRANRLWAQEVQTTWPQALQFVIQTHLCVSLSVELCQSYLLWQQGQMRPASAKDCHLTLGSTRLRARTVSNALWYASFEWSSTKRLSHRMRRNDFKSQGTVAARNEPCNLCIQTTTPGQKSSSEPTAESTNKNNFFLILGQGSPKVDIKMPSMLLLRMLALTSSVTIRPIPSLTCHGLLASPYQASFTLSLPPGTHNKDPSEASKRLVCGSACAKVRSASDVEPAGVSDGGGPSGSSPGAGAVLEALPPKDFGGTAAVASPSGPSSNEVKVCFDILFRNVPTALPPAVTLVAISETAVAPPSAAAVAAAAAA
mmetsp:Transcript_139268/g.445191  ORF Transcript_139268/g.445191 Transcript_139268/m.445191 type:complete len:317 (+) Transcript_139268:186-1136(+)